MCLMTYVEKIYRQILNFNLKKKLIFFLCLEQRSTFMIAGGKATELKTHFFLIRSTRNSIYLQVICQQEKISIESSVFFFLRLVFPFSIPRCILIIIIILYQNILPTFPWVIIDYLSSEFLFLRRTNTFGFYSTTKKSIKRTKH